MTSPKNKKLWNWQRSDWPEFCYFAAEIDAFEQEFLHNSGIAFGVSSHLSDEEKSDLKISLISNEAYKTSSIEGQILDRDSLQSSIKRHFGLKAPSPRNHPAENGISEMMIDLYHHYALPLTDEILWSWNAMLMNGRRDLQIGQYRSHEEAIQVVSGFLHKPTIHFEAPPSKAVSDEMEKFIKWFNDTAPSQPAALPPLTRCAIAHLYFVSIHPFEDGNGRIARALVEKVLAQHLKQPTLIALSETIDSEKKHYYAALANQNWDNAITPWIIYLAKTVLNAQEYTIAQINFLIEKNKFFDRYQNQMNTRQHKVVVRLMDQGVKGFEGGLSAKNYMSIAKTSASTATRDLHDLVEKKILVLTGTRKSTRYWLAINQG